MAVKIAEVVELHARMQGAGRGHTSLAGRPMALFRWTSSMPANVSFMKSLHISGV